MLNRTLRPNVSRPGMFPAAMLVLAALVCAASSARAEEKKDDMPTPQPRVFKDAVGNTMPYLLLAPKDYNPAKKYPLVLFYHGVGECGDDNKSQWKNGIEVFQKPENREKFPCFVVAPQCPKGRQWVNVPWSADSEIQPEEPSDQLKLSLGILTAVQKEFAIDADRLYVAGLSMGGFAVWDVSTRHPDLFAAAMPICGGGDEKQAAKIAKLPLWAFHGGQDTVVKTFRSRNMINAMKLAGGDPKYTEYPAEGHGSWTPAFHEPELLPWMFAQARRR
jgi:predicted peptidase